MALTVQVKRIQIAETKFTELRYIEAANSGRGAILVLPALGVPANYYDRLLKSLAKNGRSCGTIDFQGQGKSSVVVNRGTNYGYHELLIEDIPSAITEMAALFNAPVTILGHSLGGQLGCLYSSLNDQRVSGLILCTTCSVYYKMWPGMQKIRVLLSTQFARAYARITGYFPGAKFGFGGDSFQRLINDWGRQALTGNYSIENSSINFERELQKVTIPILAIHLDVDFLAPPAAVHHLLNKLKMADKSIVCIDNSGLTHFSWARHPDIFIDKIETWYGNVN